MDFNRPPSYNPECNNRYSINESYSPLYHNSYHRNFDPASPLLSNHQNYYNGDYLYPSTTQMQPNSQTNKVNTNYVEIPLTHCIHCHTTCNTHTNTDANINNSNCDKECDTVSTVSNKQDSVSTKTDANTNTTDPYTESELKLCDMPCSRYFVIIWILILATIGVFWIPTDFNLVNQYNDQITCIVNSDGRNPTCIVQYYIDPVYDTCPHNYTYQIMNNSSSVCVSMDISNTALNSTIVEECLNLQIDSLVNPVKTFMHKSSYFFDIILSTSIAIASIMSWCISCKPKAILVITICCIGLLCTSVMQSLYYILNSNNVDNILSYDYCYKLVNEGIFTNIEFYCEIGFLLSVICILINMVAMVFAFFEYVYVLGKKLECKA